MALHEVYGKDCSIYSIPFAGKTDWQIIFELLTDAGLNSKDIEYDISRCFQVMSSYFENVLYSLNLALLPNVREALKVLQEDGHLLGVVSGNLSAIGYAKLSALHLEKFLSVYAFGDQGGTRAELVSFALAKAKDLMGGDGEHPANLIGDTVSDVEAAIGAGARPISVLTGGSTEAQLRAAGTTLVLQDLSDQRFSTLLTRTIS